MMRALLLCLVVACSYSEDLGDTRRDGRGVPAGGGPAESGGCDGFLPPPATDCTAPHEPCTFDDDCRAGQSCNFATRRCFSASDRCVGTPCEFDSDCGSGERCSLRTGQCFDLSESQACLPCATDADCGGSQCIPFENVCE